MLYFGVEGDPYEAFAREQAAAAAAATAQQ